jgi:hypothetical protein
MGSLCEASRLARSLVRGALLATLFYSGRLTAQSVRGQLVDARTGEPIARAFVALLDTSGVEVTRALVGDEGTFWLQAPVPGAYRLRFKRIGFRPSESSPLSLVADQTADVRLQVEAIPTVLSPVVVEGQPACGNRGDEATVVARLWEEVQEALDVVTWTERAAALDYTVETYQRELSADGKRVLHEGKSTRSGRTISPFATAPTERLARNGYVVTGAKDTLVFYAPDAEVLLSGAFTQTHCFTARPADAEHPGQVGLAFELAPGRRVVDVRGVLWLDAKTLGLRVLEFMYAYGRGSFGSGYVEFMPLPSGTWIVNRWWIRMAPTWVRRLHQRESGGHVVSITTAGGALLYAAGDPILVVDVVDSSRGGLPLPHARVELAGTDHRFRADDHGHLEVALPLEGSYGVVFRHPRLDSLRVDPEPASVSLVRGGRSTVILSLPPEERMISRLCGAGVAAPARVLLGTVRDPAGGPVAGATIHLEWQVKLPGLVQLGVPAVEVPADSLGRYLLCGVPAGVVSLYAVAGDRRSPPIVLGFEDSGVWIDRALYRSWPGRMWIQDLTFPP